MYATPADMEARYGALALQRLTDREHPPAGAVNLVLLNARLQDASDLVDGYLVGRYTTPMETFPAVLKVHTCAICMYLLMGAGADKDSTERRDYDAALAYLGRVAERKIDLLPPAVGEPAVGAGMVYFSPGAKDHARDAGEADDGFWSAQ
jgi:phage gp36-like protein